LSEGKKRKPTFRQILVKFKRKRLKIARCRRGEEKGGEKATDLLYHSSQFPGGQRKKSLFPFCNDGRNHETKKRQQKKGKKRYSLLGGALPGDCWGVDKGKKRESALFPLRWKREVFSFFKEVGRKEEKIV